MTPCDRRDRTAAFRRPPLRAAWLLIAALLAACSSSSNDENIAKIPVEQLYNQGLDALNAGRYKLATKRFDQLQSNYPYSAWAASAQLMDAYAQYASGKFSDSAATLDRFIQLHPTSKDIAYAYYLRALDFYEQIVDVQ